jgi:dephospho-CoA kinase
LVIGIDVGKDKHHAFMGSATGKSLFRKLIFENPAIRKKLERIIHPLINLERKRIVQNLKRKET